MAPLTQEEMGTEYLTNTTYIINCIPIYIYPSIIIVLFI